MRTTLGGWRPRIRASPDGRLAGEAYHDAQLRPGRDAQLGEDAVQVRADGAVRQVQPLPDLPVGQPLGRQLRDLQLVRCQLVTSVRVAAPAGLPCGAQLPAGTLAPRDRAEG